MTTEPARSVRPALAALVLVLALLVATAAAYVSLARAAASTFAGAHAGQSSLAQWDVLPDGR